MRALRSRRTCLDGNVRRYGYIAYGILRTHFVLRQCQRAQVRANRRILKPSLWRGQNYS